MLKPLVQQCVAYQVDHLSSYIKKSDAAKYLDDDDLSVAPYAVVAPYFYVTETTLDQWLPGNVRAAELAVEEKAAGKRFAAVVVSQGVAVDADARKQLCDAFWAVALDGFLVWIDNLDEQSASGAELRGLKDLCGRLRLGGEREVINIHGGYFSILAAGPLGDHSLSGVAHGPEFGDYRGVTGHRRGLEDLELAQVGGSQNAGSLVVLVAAADLTTHRTRPSHRARRLHLER